MRLAPWFVAALVVVRALATVFAARHRPGPGVLAAADPVQREIDRRRESSAAISAAAARRSSARRCASCGARTIRWATLADSCPPISPWAGADVRQRRARGHRDQPGESLLLLAHRELAASSAPRSKRHSANWHVIPGTGGALGARQAARGQHRRARGPAGRHRRRGGRHAHFAVARATPARAPARYCWPRPRASWNEARWMNVDQQLPDPACRVATDAGRARGIRRAHVLRVLRRGQHARGHAPAPGLGVAPRPAARGDRRSATRHAARRAMTAALAGFAQLRAGKRPAACRAQGSVELWRFYVDKPWQGQGLARALMDAREARARARGARELWLGVWERNERAQAFYRKMRLPQGGHADLRRRHRSADRRRACCGDCERAHRARRRLGARHRRGGGVLRAVLRRAHRRALRESAQGIRNRASSSSVAARGSSS